MKVLITGANGYIGHGIVRKFLEHGHDVVAADLNIENIDSRADIKKCDIFQIDSPYLYFNKPEMLVHLAWKDGCSHYSSSHIANLFHHDSFIRHFCESGVEKIAVTGSVHEIGKHEGAVDENTPCRPLSPYGISKNALRGLLLSAGQQYKKPVQWLRRYYVVGNSGLGDTIFSKMVRASRAGVREFPFTSGLNEYDFLDYDDFCNKFYLAAMQDEINGIINICSGKPEKLIDRVEQFIKENHLNIRLNIGAYPERENASRSVWGSAEKIQKIEMSAGKMQKD